MAAESQVHCFETLLAGQTHTGYAAGFSNCPELKDQLKDHRAFDCRAEYLPEFKALFRAFRANAMLQFNVTEAPQPHPPRIVFLHKDTSAAEHKFVISNMDECLRETARRFPDAVVEQAMWTTKSLKQQVELMSRADVVVSVPGSDVITGVWMPATSELIQVCRHWPLSPGSPPSPERGNEQFLWFAFSHHVQIWCEGLPYSDAGITLPMDGLERRIRAALSRQQVEGVVEVTA